MSGLVGSARRLEPWVPPSLHWMSRALRQRHRVGRGQRGSPSASQGLIGLVRSAQFPGPQAGTAGLATVSVPPVSRTFGGSGSGHGLRRAGVLGGESVAGSGPRRAAALDLSDAPRGALHTGTGGRFSALGVATLVGVRDPGGAPWRGNCLTRHFTRRPPRLGGDSAVRWRSASAGECWSLDSL